MAAPGEIEMYLSNNYQLDHLQGTRQTSLRHNPMAGVIKSFAAFHGMH
jgi:hypothetical protein